MSSNCQTATEERRLQQEGNSSTTPNDANGAGTGTETDDNDDTTCCQECNPLDARPKLIRIATWTHAAPYIQGALEAYEKAAVALRGIDAVLEEDANATTNGSSGSSRRNIPPQAANLRLTVLPSMQELHQEVQHDLQTSSRVYDAFVLPPMMMGDALQYNGLATLDLNGQGGMTATRTTTDMSTVTLPSPIPTPSNLQDYYQDLLPYYRDQVATLDGRIRGLPLGAGNQLLVLYRKDYLETASEEDLPLPTTWGEYIRIAEALHQQPLGPGGTAIYGSCLGRLTEAQCRRQRDREGGDCTSKSLAYVASTLAPMTQTEGSSTGWLFDANVTLGMQPLLNKSLERSLVFMENQLKYGHPDELTSDASLNLDQFRQGQCALTITSEHPPDLLNDPNVGFLPVPGAHNVLDRTTETMADCTEELCPFGKELEGWGIVNQAPYGTDDLLVGTIASTTSPEDAQTILDFWAFAIETQALNQPMTYSDLQGSTIEGYEDVIGSLVESNNTATPLRIPSSFRLLSDLDNQVNDYLATSDYSEVNRQGVRKSTEASFAHRITSQDELFLALPTTAFYEKSLGTFTPDYGSDMYIGDIPRYIGWGIGGLSCLCSIYFALWTWRHQHHPVILATQSVFLYMICGGTFLMAGTIFPFGIEDDIAEIRNVERSCMASMWFYALGYSLVLSAHFSKIWRINRVFRSARNLQRIKIQSVDILVPLLVLWGINLTLLTTWNITDRVRWVRDPIYDPADSLNPEAIPTFGYCDSEYYRIYLGLMLGINYIFSLVALVQAYEIRKITTDYGESLWISGALACAVQVWTIGLPLLKLLDDEPRALFFVKALVVFLTTMTSLLLIFVPKVGYLRQARIDPKGQDYLGLSKDSVTSQEHSHATDDTHKNYEQAGRMANWRISGLEPPSTPSAPSQPKRSWEELEGIRIIQSSTSHSEEVERLEKSLRQAEKRHKSLNDRLERIQEKLEQYIVSNHPHTHDNNNFILSARSEQTRISTEQTRISGGMH